MKSLFIVLLIASLQSDPEALVDASKEAKAKRKKSTTKVITNNDVKKSKGKIVERSKLPPVAVENAPEPVTQAQHDADRKAGADRAVKIAATEKRIAELEAELAKIEQSYFEENDPNVRDGSIVKKFNETKAKLHAAQGELAALRPVETPAATSPIVIADQPDTHP